MATTKKRIPRNQNNPAYVFIPNAAQIPSLYENENVKDPIAVLKFFTPDSSFTWFVIEHDPEQRLCFGLVIGHERELGYFSLEELEEVRGPLGLPIERDLHFKPCPISQCK